MNSLHIGCFTAFSETILMNCKQPWRLYHLNSHKAWRSDMPWMWLKFALQEITMHFLCSTGMLHTWEATLWYAFTALISLFARRLAYEREWALPCGYSNPYPNPNTSPITTITLGFLGQPRKTKGYGCHT